MLFTSEGEDLAEQADSRYENEQHQREILEAIEKLTLQLLIWLSYFIFLAYFNHFEGRSDSKCPCGGDA